MKLDFGLTVVADVVLQRGYRVKLDQQTFTAPVDRMDLVCAKNAADILNEVGGDMGQFLHVTIHERITMFFFSVGNGYQNDEIKTLDY